MPVRRELRILLILSILLLASCGGSGSSVIYIYEGQWEVRINAVTDECGLLDNEVSSFDDRQLIEQQGSNYVLDSQFLPAGEYSGIRSEGDLLFELTREGDLFGDGIFCSIPETLRYTSVTAGEMQLLYNIRIQCADGFVCNSVLRGTAERE